MWPMGTGPQRIGDPLRLIGVVDPGEIMLRWPRLAARTGIGVVARLPAAVVIIPLLVVLFATVLTVVRSRPASAGPGTPVSYPAGAAATRFGGPAFDTCTAPSLSTIKAWSASPYRAIGVYIGGHRSCSQPQLTAGWAGELTRRGWRLLPIYVGRQATCADRNFSSVISRTTAATTQGADAGAAAVSNAKSLGLLAGSGIYLDIEHYDPTDTACRTAVIRYISGWTKQLHGRGYLAGVYINTAGAKQLVQSYASGIYARPDAIWLARWDRSASLVGWSGVPGNKWALHQRAKQYRGDHYESYGGVSLRIDTDKLDAPVGSVAYPYRVTANGLRARAGPGTSHSVAGVLPRGAAIRVVCRTHGTKIGTTSIWDKLTDGSYVSDFYVSTPARTSYPVPPRQCTYP